MTTVGGSLRVQFLDDDDGTGKLMAYAEANGFAGQAGAYFSKADLEEFAASLCAFPLVGRPAIAGGFHSKTKPDELAQVLLALACYPIDRQGHLGLHVRLSTELWPPARIESQHIVTLEIQTTYEALARFARALAAVVGGNVEEAVLVGEG